VHSLGTGQVQNISDNCCNCLHGWSRWDGLHSAWKQALGGERLKRLQSLLGAARRDRGGDLPVRLDFVPKQSSWSSLMKRTRSFFVILSSSTPWSSLLLHMFHCYSWQLWPRRSSKRSGKCPSVRLQLLYRCTRQRATATQSIIGRWSAHRRAKSRICEATVDQWSRSWLLRPVVRNRDKN